LAVRKRWLLPAVLGHTNGAERDEVGGVLAEVDERVCRGLARALAVCCSPALGRPPRLALVLPSLVAAASPLEQTGKRQGHTVFGLDELVGGMTKDKGYYGLLQFVSIFFLFF
jgi:hypothetical protein